MKKVEGTLLRFLIRGLAKIGYKPIAVFDGAEQVKVRGEAATLKVVDSVDDSTITFSNGKRNMGVLVVLGNGIDCVVDHNVGDPVFNKFMDEDFYNYWNELQERGNYES